MLISAIDPALLFYKSRDWQSRELHCFDRFDSLRLHNRITREYKQKIAVSSSLVGLIWQHFPYDARSRNVDQSHDLRQVMNAIMQRAEYIDTKYECEISIQPAEVLCEYIDAIAVIDAWKQLLCGCADVTGVECESQIATWETPAVHQSDLVSLMITHPKEGIDTQHDFTLVWNENSWAIQLAKQNWWPDLQRCVEFEFKTNSGIRDYPTVREHPIPFECSEEFQPSLDRFCTDDSRQRSLVEALTKKVYGVPVGLNDEQIRGRRMRRFRVTRFWRIHYWMAGDRIVLSEFGPHDMDGVD